MRVLLRVSAVLLLVFLLGSLVCGCKGSDTDGMLHYYFMSSEGKVFTSEGKISKWGDCCLIRFPNGENMLIDCGVAGFGPVLVENLKGLGITKLDNIVITHPHSDHQNGIFHEDNLTGAGVLDQFEIGRVYHRGGTDPVREDSAWVTRVCEERGLELSILEKGHTLEFGKVKAEVLWPMPGTSGKMLSGGVVVNDNSIVIRFDYGEHSSLFAGDLYVMGENQLINEHAGKLDVDLLKVPHHGNDTSSTERFLQMVSPEIAVATGYVEIPDAVETRFRAVGARLLGDRAYGNIHISTDGKSMNVETSMQPDNPS